MSFSCQDCKSPDTDSEDDEFLFVCRHQKLTFYEKKLLNAVPSLTREELNKIIEVKDSMCHHCWEAGKECQCWNDE